MMIKTTVEETTVEVWPYIIRYNVGVTIDVDHAFRGNVHDSQEKSIACASHIQKAVRAALIEWNAGGRPA